MMDNIFEIAEKADNLKNEKDINNVREFYSDLKSIILSVFKYKFSLEELNENVETDELMKVFKDICSRISGEMKKN